MSPWTEQRVERLKQLAAEGLSAGQIASALDCGLSRNAVIGKMKRLDIPFLNNHGGRQKGSKNKTEKKMRALHERSIIRRIAQPFLPKSEFRCDTIEPLGIEILDLAPHHCRWPLEKGGKLGLVMYCGLDRVEGSSYCRGHRRSSITHAPQISEVERFRRARQYKKIGGSGVLPWSSSAPFDPTNPVDQLPEPTTVNPTNQAA